MVRFCRVRISCSGATGHPTAAALVAGEKPATALTTLNPRFRAPGDI